MRLLLLGYYESPFVHARFSRTTCYRLTQLWRRDLSPEGTYVYHLKPKATPLILLVVGLWVWMWGVFRGIARVTIAGVVGEWYFHRCVRSLPLLLSFSSPPLTASFASRVCQRRPCSPERDDGQSQADGPVRPRLRDRDHSNRFQPSDRTQSREHLPQRTHHGRSTIHPASGVLVEEGESRCGSRAPSRPLMSAKSAPFCSI